MTFTLNFWAALDQVTPLKLKCLPATSGVLTSPCELSEDPVFATLLSVGLRDPALDVKLPLGLSLREDKATSPAGPGAEDSASEAKVCTRCQVLVITSEWGTSALLTQLLHVAER